ncbi:GOLPH3/VPS74 family protein [Iningainema tapete]|uniref:GPP34 family phosphoprotein n=1 Tax=Iningainema tapete BLCC-T55 TaxID=2748662 RepID=A0A8J7CB33_9CYAN|nr:GPP34 family phosphoprotein [Iningainema tapete]MBD2777871.1 GPP34 family phosphoprotein [Iningainema tapete BLCC-T55]
MQYIAQELMLLAVHDEKGSIVSSATQSLPYGLIGAVLLELVLQGKLISEDGKLFVVNATTTGDEFFDDCLNEILTARRNRDARFWVTHLVRKFRGFQYAVLSNLVELGVLKQEKHRVLGLFSVQRYTMINPRAKHVIVDRVRSSVLNKTKLDSRTVSLISLIKACNLTNYLFAPEERKQARQRIAEIVSGELVGNAVSETVASVQAAVNAGITAAVVASTVSSSSSNS